MPPAIGKELKLVAQKSRCEDTSEGSDTCGATLVGMPDHLPK